MGFMVADVSTVRGPFDVQIQAVLHDTWKRR